MKFRNRSEHQPSLRKKSRKLLILFLSFWDQNVRVSNNHKYFYVTVIYRSLSLRIITSMRTGLIISECSFSSQHKTRLKQGCNMEITVYILIQYSQAFDTVLYPILIRNKEMYLPQYKTSKISSLSDQSLPAVSALLALNN